MHKSSRVTSRGSASSFDRNDPSRVRFAKLRYFWEETSSNDVGWNGTIHVTHSAKALNLDKVVIRRCKKDIEMHLKQFK